jgi:glycosyltransferase involved in cell wall biosynthesis
VCVVSGVLRDLLVERGVEPERVLVTPNGVNLADFDFPDPGAARARARRELGLDPADADGADADESDARLARDGGEVVVGFVGYYRRWHRLDVVFDALRAPALSRLRLVLVGEGPEHAELVRRSAEPELAGRVVFAGPRPHARIPALLPAFDVAVVPAINEYASPLKLYEYMAAGLAVVAPDQPNLREVVTHGSDGWLVPVGDVEAMSDALGTLAADAERRAALGRAARRTIEERDLTWTHNARRVVEAVRALGGGRT